MRKFISLALCITILFSGFVLAPQAVWGDSGAGRQEHISQIQDVLARIDREWREFQATRDSLLSGMPSSQPQYDPSEIDKVLADSRKTVEIEQALGQLALDYMDKCRSPLSALQELAPYLERFDPTDQAMKPVVENMIANEQQQLGMLEQMRQAYYNDDTPGWNSLNQQYDALREAHFALAPRLKELFETHQILMSDATSFLQQELATLQQQEQAASVEAKRQLLAGTARTLLPNPLPKNSPYQPAGKTTRCSKFVFDFAKKLGYTVPELGGDKEYRASDQLDKLAASAKTGENGWKSIDFTGDDAAKAKAFEEAWQAANQGKLVIVGWKNPKPTPTDSGHVAVVVPSEALTPKSGKWNMQTPYVAQAGTAGNCKALLGLNYGFSPAQKGALQIFVLDR